MKSNVRSRSACRAVAALGSLMLANCAMAQVLTFEFPLVGGQEVPVNASSGSGTATVTLDVDSGELNWNIEYSNLVAGTTAAHFHGPAPIGINAGVQVGIPGSPTPYGGTSGTLVGTATINNTQIQQLLDGLWYINIHSSAFPGGEIRGQVLPMITYDFPLSGEQEVPSNDSTGSGNASVAIHPETGLLTWNIEYQDLVANSTAAHFHGPAPVGVNAGVQVGIPGNPTSYGVTSGTLLGSNTINPTQVQQLLDGLWYINIHSTKFPGGEIRGQVVDAPAGGACCLGDGTCQQRSALECADLGGEYAGDGSLCADVDCSPAVDLALTYHFWIGPDGVFIPAQRGDLTFWLPEPDDEVILWMNAAVNGAWLVQNKPVMEVEGGLEVVPYVFHVPYAGVDVAPGMEVTVHWSLTTDQMSDGPAPSGNLVTVPIIDHIFNAGNGAADGGEELGPLADPEGPPANVPPAPEVDENPPPTEPVPWERVRQREVPGIAEQFNHCVPGAFARMLAWMNDRYCLGLPAENSTAEQIYEKLRNGDHMETSKARGTIYGGATADGFDTNDGPMEDGLEQFLADKGLGNLLEFKINMFRNQDAENPAHDPCDIFDRLKQGKGIVGYWGYYSVTGQMREHLQNTREDANEWIDAADAVLDELEDILDDGDEVSPEDFEFVNNATTAQLQNNIDRGAVLGEMTQQIIDLVSALDPPDADALNQANALHNNLAARVQALQDVQDGLAEPTNTQELYQNLLAVRNAIAAFHNSLLALLGPGGPLAMLEAELTPEQRNEITRNSTHPGFRTGGHAITIVGAVKCGEDVVIYYRDDAHGGDSQNDDDQNGDTTADTGTKVARFVKEGASGWTLNGYRWEGYTEICPTLEAIVAAAADKAMKLLQEAADADQQLDDGVLLLLEQILALIDGALDLEDIAGALKEALAELEGTCPEAEIFTDRVLNKIVVVTGLAEFLLEQQSPETTAQMTQIANEINEQMGELQKALDACVSLPDCPADLTGDDTVGVPDLLALLAAWGDCVAGEPCPADLTGDGSVGVPDLLLLLSQWGNCPEEG